jgi:hypothetical protein
LDAEPLRAGASYDCKPWWLKAAKNELAEPQKLTIRSTGTSRANHDFQPRIVKKCYALNQPDQAMPHEYRTSGAKTKADRTV